MEVNRITPDENSAADFIKKLDRRIKSLETGATGNVVIRDAMWTTDPTTGVKTVIGKLPDGSFGLKEWINDTTPPEQPTAPSVVASLGVYNVGWDGLDLHGDQPPKDYSRTVVEMSTSANGPWAVMGELYGKSTLSVADQPYNEERFFRLLSYDKNNNESTPSSVSSATLLPLVEDISISDAITELEKQTQAAEDAAAKATAAANLASKTLEDAKQAALDAIGAEAGKGGVILSDGAPVDPVYLDGNWLWLNEGVAQIDHDGDPNTPAIPPPYVYDGANWIASADPAVIDAAAEVVRQSGLAQQAFDKAVSAAETAGTAQQSANSKNTIWYETPPVDGEHKVGDTWFDSANDNKIMVWDGDEWISKRDQLLNRVEDTATEAKTTAESKNSTYYDVSEPVGTTEKPLIKGDLWFDIDNEYKLHTYTGTVWQETQDSAKALATAELKARTFFQDTEPTGGTYSAGDIWYDTNDNNHPYGYINGDWVSARDGKISVVEGKADDAQATANTKNSSYYEDVEPVGTTEKPLVEGDTWFDTNDGYKLYTYTGSTWQKTQDTAGAIETAEGVEDRAISRGTDLVTNGTGFLGNNYNFSDFVYEPAESPTGTTGGFSVTTASGRGPGLSTDENIPVSLDKHYVISAWAKESNPAAVGSTTYIGLRALDASGSSIGPPSYSYHGNTTTELAQPVNPGDTTIELLDGSNWMPSSVARYIGIWNYVDADGKVWPVGTYTKNNPTIVSVAGTTVTLESPYDGPPMPAGTPVSNMEAGGTYLYCTAANESLTGEWKQFSGKVGGLFDGSTAKTAKHAFPPGTQTVEIIFLTNYNGMVDSKQIYAGISMSDSAAAYTEAQEAQTTANTALQAATHAGLNIFDTDTPSGSAPKDSIWFQYDEATEVIIGQWQQIGGDAETDGSNWVERPVGNQVIANLDAGKITAGFLDSDRIEANSISAGKLDASVIDGDFINAGLLSADEIRTKLVNAELIDAVDIIAQNSITATNGIIESLDADLITVGTLDADRIASGSLVVSQLGGPEANVLQKNLFNSTSIPQDEPGAWYRIAMNKGSRASGHFILRDLTSSQHMTVVFDSGVMYNNNPYINLTGYTKYGSASFMKVRMLTKATYDDVFLEVYVAPDTASRSQDFAYWVTENIQQSGWEPVDWVPNTTGIPADYNVLEVDLNEENVTTAVANNAKDRVDSWSADQDITLIDGGNIYTGTIRASSIHSELVDAGYINVNALKAEDIRTKILDAELVDAKDIIAENSITTETGIIAELDGGIITADTISGTSIKARTLTAEHLVVASADNYIPWEVNKDPATWAPHEPESGAEARVLPDGTLFLSNATVPAGTWTPVLQLRSGYTAWAGSINGNFNVTPGDKMLLTAKLSLGGNYSGTHPNANVSVYFRDVNGAYMHGIAGPTVPVDWEPQETVFEFEVPAGAASMYIYVRQDQPGGLVVDAPYMRKRGLGKLIVDGEITSDKIAAKAVKAEKIDVNSIWADSAWLGEARAQVLTIGAIGPDELSDDVGTDSIAGLDTALASKMAAVLEGQGISKTFSNVMSFQDSGLVDSPLVIDTPITPTTKMCSVVIKGFNWRNGESEIAAQVSWYSRSESELVVNSSQSTTGSFPVKISVIRKLDTNTVSLMIESVSLGNFSYPQITIAEAIIGYSTPPDSWKNGWSTRVNPPISEYDVPANATPPARDLNDSHTLTQGWRTAGTTTINGGHIETDTIKADSLDVGEIWANTLWANEAKISILTADAIQSNMIAADAITSTKIDADAINGMTITGAIIQTDVESNLGLKFDTNGLKAWDANNYKFFDLNKDGLYMSGDISTHGGFDAESALSAGSIVMKGEASTAHLMGDPEFLGESVIQLYTGFNTGNGPAEIFADDVNGYPSAWFVGAANTTATDLSARPYLSLGFDPQGRKQASISADSVVISSWDYGTEIIGRLYVGGEFDVSGELTVSRGKIMMPYPLDDYGRTFIQSDTPIDFTGVNTIAFQDIRAREITTDNGTIWSGGVDMHIQGNGTEISFGVDGGGKYFRCKAIRDRVYSTASPQVAVTSAGTLGFTGSLERLKINIDRKWKEKDSWKAVKSLNPVTYYDKGNAERYAAYLDGGEDIDAEFPMQTLGFIAEDVNEHMPVLNTYDDRGGLLGVAYERVAAAHQPWLLEHETEIDELKRRIDQLEKIVETLTS